MEPWIKRVIDFTDCKSIYDLHEVVMKELEFPDFYGRNLDAMWDCVTGMMYTPADITVRGISNPNPFVAEKIQGMIEVFKDAEIMYKKIRLHIEE